MTTSNFISVVSQDKIVGYLNYNVREWLPLYLKLINCVVEWGSFVTGTMAKQRGLSFWITNNTIIALVVRGYRVRGFYLCCGVYGYAAAVLLSGRVNGIRAFLTFGGRRPVSCHAIVAMDENGFVITADRKQKKSAVTIRYFDVQSFVWKLLYYYEIVDNLYEIA